MWGSCIQVVHFGPPTWRSTGHFCTSGFGGRVQAGTLCISRNRDTPQVWYQVLKLSGFALFQSRFRLTSFNKTITIACVVCLCVCLFLKICIYSTLDLNQRTGVEAESRTGWADGWLGRRSSLRCAPDFLAQHQHWEPRPLPHPSTALLSTCLVLEIRCSPIF